MSNIKIIEHLKEHDIKISTQRVVIYSYLYNMLNHPTVDKIYNDLIVDYPMMSKTTIYNTLKLFVEKGLVQTLIVEDGELRYDANTTFHAHFKCSKCEKIYDILLNADFAKPTNGDFIIHETHINYRGLCEHCNKSL